MAARAVRVVRPSPKRANHSVTTAAPRSPDTVIVRTCTGGLAANTVSNERPAMKHTDNVYRLAKHSLADARRPRLSETEYKWFELAKLK